MQNGKTQTKPTKTPFEANASPFSVSPSAVLFPCFPLFFLWGFPWKGSS